MASSLPQIRSVTVSTKVSEDEYAQLEKLAQARGMTVSGWCREVLLATVEKPLASAAEETILAEVLALRMLYLNTGPVSVPSGEAQARKLLNELEYRLRL